MSRTADPRAVVGVLAVVSGLLMATGPAGADGVSVALTPGPLTIEPGATFQLDVTVTQAGPAFNGFDAIIGWDPAALTPVSHEEGALMTGACGNTFHSFRGGAGADTIADVLLCGGVSLTGPGQIYKLQFRASLTPQVTTVRFLPSLQFYNAGLYVPLASATDASIAIGMPPVAVEAPATPRQPRVRIAPNPTRGEAVFTIDADYAGLQRIRVMDARGRVVRRFDDSVSTAGVRSIRWDGCDSAGRRLPSGSYLVTLEVAGRTASSRVSLIR